MEAGGAGPSAAWSPSKVQIVLPWEAEPSLQLLHFFLKITHTCKEDVGRRGRYAGRNVPSKGEEFRASVDASAIRSLPFSIARIFGELRFIGRAAPQAQSLAAGLQGPKLGREDHEVTGFKRSHRPAFPLICPRRSSDHRLPAAGRIGRISKHAPAADLHLHLGSKVAEIIHICRGS